MQNKEYRILGFIVVKMKLKAVELFDFKIDYNKTYYLWNIPIFKIKLSEMDVSDVIMYDPRKKAIFPYAQKSKHPELVKDE